MGQEKREKMEMPNLTETPLNMRNCTRCGLMFQYMGSGHLICPRCREADLRDFDRVRTYIYDHKGATILEVSDALNIRVPIIEGFLRTGRLEIPEDSPIFLRCERCHKEIRSGRFCPDCAGQLTQDMKKVLNFDESHIGEVAVSHKGKMHFMGKDK